MLLIINLKHRIVQFKTTSLTWPIIFWFAYQLVSKNNLYIFDYNIVANILYIFVVIDFSHIPLLNTCVFFPYILKVLYNSKIILWLSLKLWVTVFIHLFEFCELHILHMWKSFVARSQFTRAYPLLQGILIPENYDVLCASLH